MTAKKVDFRALLTDTKQFPDTMMFTLGDGAEVSLADLRAFDQQRGGELATELERQRKALEKDQTELKAASERVAKLYIDTEARAKALEAGGGGNRGGGNEDILAPYERDEVFGPVVKHMRSREADLNKQLTEVTSKLDNLVKSVGAMGVTYMGDKASRDFAEIMAGEDPVRPKDLTLDSLYKMAVERRIYDRNNLPDLRKTYDELTRDARHKYEVDAAEKRGADKLLEQQREGAMLPMPSGGQFGPRVPGGEMPKDLGDAFAKAGQDKNLWKDVHQPNLILGGAIQ